MTTDKRTTTLGELQRDIMRLVNGCPFWYTTQVIIEYLGYPEASVHRACRRLRERGYLRSVPVAGKLRAWAVTSKGQRWCREHPEEDDFKCGTCPKDGCSL